MPERDQDTGLQVGTQSRARAILTSPLTVGIAGAGALLGGEALLPVAATSASAASESGAVAAVAAPEAGTAAIAPVAEGTAVAPAVEEAEALTPLAEQYLSRSGGRLGNTATRKQLHEIAKEHVKTGEFKEFQGDGMGPEEYIPGAGPGTKGSTYVDFTAKAADGTRVRIQTISTLPDGITATPNETAAAARIKASFPTDKLTLIPKVKP